MPSDKFVMCRTISFAFTTTTEHLCFFLRLNRFTEETHKGREEYMSMRLNTSVNEEFGAFFQTFNEHSGRFCFTLEVQKQVVQLLFFTSEFFFLLKDFQLKQ